MWMVWLVCGCGFGADDGGDDDDSCHYDCLFSGLACQDGVVSTYWASAIPCDEWNDEWGDDCPAEESETCQEGCRTDGVTELDLDEPWQRLCEEGRPRQVGEPCVDPSDCLPEVATWDDEGNVTNVYLACDLELGECVAREPPVVEDWLAPICGLEPGDQEGSGVVPRSACSGGLCLYEVRDGCIAQGCTLACAGDGDCPPGAVCEPDWNLCTSGPPDTGLGDDLVCPP
jgi:hypothetical protein